MIGKPEYNYCTEWLVTRNVVQAETPDEAWEVYDFMYPFNF